MQLWRGGARPELAEGLHVAAVKRVRGRPAGGHIEGTGLFRAQRGSLTSKQAVDRDEAQRLAGIKKFDTPKEDKRRLYLADIGGAPLFFVFVFFLLFVRELTSLSAAQRHTGSGGAAR